MKIVIAIIIVVIAFRICFLYIEQKGLYHPEKEILQTPESVGIAYEEVNFKTTDGQILNGWFVPAHNARVTMLYCHGNAGNISHRVHKVKFFHDMGINFFIFDYRGYGKSSGRASESGLYKDAQAAYDYLKARRDVDTSSIVVYGKSLGGPVAADLCMHRKAKALILEGSFANVALRAQQLYPFLPMKILITQKYDTIAKVRKLHIPKLIAHGSNDDVISFGHAKLLFKAAAEPKTFLAFEGGHNDDVYITSAQFKSEVDAFLVPLL
jgi:uncharacterized protein